MAKTKKTEPAWPPLGRLNASGPAGVRGIIIERFATVEAIIDAVISSYYFPVTRAPQEFQEDVLFDESFSFALRRSIFEKILRREGLYDDKRMNDIRRMNKIRNLAAHLRGVHFEPQAQELAAEFLHVAGRVEKHFVGLVLKLGVRLSGLPSRQDLLRSAEDELQ